MAAGSEGAPSGAVAAASRRSPPEASARIGAAFAVEIASAAQKSSAVCRAQLGAVPPARAAAPRVLRSHLAGMDAFRSGSGVRGVRRALPRDQVAHAQGPGKDRERGGYVAPARKDAAIDDVKPGQAMHPTLGVDDRIRGIPATHE